MTRETPDTEPSRPLVMVLVTIGVGAHVLGWVGDLLLAELVDRRPLLLTALNPNNRTLLLVTNELDALSYYTVAFVRLVVFDPIYYLLGFWFGGRVVNWLAARWRWMARWERVGERGVRGVVCPLVFIAPSSYVSLLAGAVGVRFGLFMGLNLAGTAARLWVIRVLGERLEVPLDAAVALIVDHRLIVFAASVAMVAWLAFTELRGADSVRSAQD